MTHCPYCHHDLKPVCGQCKKPIRPATEYAVACCDKLVHLRCCRQNKQGQLICLEHWTVKANRQSVHVNQSGLDQFLANRVRPDPPKETP